MLTRKLTWLGATSALLGAGFFGCNADETAAPGAGGATASSSVTVTATSSVGPVTSSSSGMMASSAIAKSCSQDSDCGNEVGMRCVDASVDEPLLTIINDPVGGPAGGYCTKDCLAHTDCPTDAFCIGDDAGGLCVKACTYGLPAQEFVDDPTPPDKCSGRDDLMCVPLNGGNNGCFPVCGSDDECGSGRHCSLKSGMCVTAAPKGDPLSHACTPDDEKTMNIDEDNCAGFCLTFVDENGDPTNHMCSGWCSLGGDLSTTKNCGGPEAGLCVFAPAVNDVPSGIGDLAFCTGACDSHGGCNYDSKMACFDVGLLEALGKGYCFGATACPNGDECDPNNVCVQTKGGPLCVEEDSANPGSPLLPLGDAAPNGTGGAGGGGAGGAGGGGTGGNGGAGGAGGGP